MPRLRLMHDTLSKRLLFLAAAAIVVVTLGYTQHLASIIRDEEQRKVQLWVEAVKQRAELVTYTQSLFEELGAEEKKKADHLAAAYRLIQESPAGMDLTFSTDFLVGNKTVPVLILNDDGEVLYHVNVPPPPLGSDREAYFDSVRVHQMGTNPPIRFEEVGQTIYYSESVRLRELREAMSELIESFISETVINSASVPVMLLDSTATRIVKSQGIDVSSLGDPEALKERLRAMASDNAPIPVYLPGEGWNLVFTRKAGVDPTEVFPSGAVVADRGVFVGGVFGVQRIQEGRTKPRVGRHGQGNGTPTGHPAQLPHGVVQLAFRPGRRPRGAVGNGQGHRPPSGGGRAVLQDWLRGGPDDRRPLASGGRDGQLHAPPHQQKREAVPRVGRTQGELPLSRPLFSWVLENLLRNAVDAMEGRAPSRFAQRGKGMKSTSRWRTMAKA